MRPLLFRLKIALLSLLMSGLLLVGFGIFFLVAIRQVGLARIDDEIRALGEPQVRSAQPVVHWQGFDRSLGFIYGDESEQRFAVRVLDTAGGAVFTSDRWPAELSDVPVPELLSAPLPPLSRRDGRVPPLPGPAYGAAGGPGGPHGDGRHFIRRLDPDGDGRVSAAESEARLNRSTAKRKCLGDIMRQLPVHHCRRIANRVRRGRVVGKRVGQDLRIAEFVQPSDRCLLDDCGLGHQCDVPH